MRAIAAKNIGFCSGVKRAVKIAQNSLKNDKKPIWFLGKLVHNELVMEKFKGKNVKFIFNPKSAKSGTLIIQAHGFPPFSNIVSKKLLIRDATCPLVKKVQILANFLYNKGYKVVIVGDRNHSEVKGINGYIKNEGIIVENKKQARKLPKFNKIGVVIQTTQRKENFNQILNILKKRSKEVKYFNTLCPEVAVRQKELTEILRKCDGILVIGSHLSANTRRLVEKVRNLKKKVFGVNSLEELKKKKLKGVSVLGVVSGTSTPNWEIKRIKKYLKKL
jgi:4-hydroxy-3-methylbut-2-enyl diphosphate reductase